MSDDQVSREAFDRSLPVPPVWAATFANDDTYWANSEDGRHPLEDEPVVSWKQLLTGQEP